MTYFTRRLEACQLDWQWKSGRQLAMKAASRETDSPLGLVTTSCWAPAARLGVVKVSVFMSLKAMDTAFAPRVTLVPLLRPLPRSVTLVPPATGPFAGSSEPI